ncbi:MAG: DMT family transporter [Polyangiaceae bacterium]
MLGEALALSAALTWSVSVVLFKRSEAISPQGMNLFKNLLSTLLLLATMPLLGIGMQADRATDDWWRLVISGVLGIAIADTLTFMALRRLGAALLAVVDCAYAPVIVGLGVLWLGEPLGPRFGIGAALVVAGVLMASSDAVKRRKDLKIERRDLIAGIAFGVTGIVAMAVGVILAKPALERGHLVEVTLVRTLSGVAAQTLWIGLVPGQRGALAALKPSPAWRTLVPASFLGSYVAMLFWLGGFKWALASTAAVLNQMSSVSTILLARIVLKEPITPRRAWGGVAAIVGAILVVSRAT